MTDIAIPVNATSDNMLDVQIKRGLRLRGLPPDTPLSRLVVEGVDGTLIGKGFDFPLIGIARVTARPRRRYDPRR